MRRTGPDFHLPLRDINKKKDITAMRTGPDFFLPNRDIQFRPIPNGGRLINNYLTQ